MPPDDETRHVGAGRFIRLRMRPVFAYRDETGLEADAVIEMPDGRWAAFEMKLGRGEVDVAAGHLLRLKGRVDTVEAGEPLALVVITATGLGYVREDGVVVIPIGALTA